MTAWTYQPYKPGTCEHIPAYPLDDWTHCDNPRPPDQAYCQQHLGSGRQVGTKLAARRKDIRRANIKWDLDSMLNDIAAELEAECL